MSSYMKRFKSSWSLNKIFNISNKIDEENQLKQALNLLSNPSIFNQHNLPTTEPEKQKLSNNIQSYLLTSLPKSNEKVVKIHYRDILYSLKSLDINKVDLTTASFQQSKEYINSIKDENELKSIFNKLYYSGKSKHNLIILIMMNPYLVDVDYIIHKINKEYSKWNKLAKIEFDILLLKKYGDLGRKTDLLNLMNRQQKAILESIENGRLLFFYQRVFWRFFLAEREDLKQYVVKYGVISTFAMWQGCKGDGLIFLQLLKDLNLSLAQRSFVNLCLTIGDNSENIRKCKKFTIDKKIQLSNDSIGKELIFSQEVLKLIQTWKRIGKYSSNLEPIERELKDSLAKLISFSELIDEKGLKFA